ncbi:MAG: UDP-N-acetylmuramoyl-tripeptide--D-alanyl-D-alanine ligase [Oscillospiraceae bacterium]|nr:UDP-N-acetylmuramoyl-tripeptide--D-alanyl-D-alanine ligase [Oscillospiraceae bacterium]
MGTITLKQAAAWCGGTVQEKYAQVSFFGACNDSRNIREGQLFVALQGQRDGHEFIPAALKGGAAAVLCSRCEGDYPAIVVEDTRKALGDIARQERLRMGMKVVGVTGSVGKSTTKEMIAAVLGSTFAVRKTPANHNNDIGMPMAVLGMPEDTQVAVLEMGMNHFREIAYLSAIAKPDVAVIVNIGTMHIEHLGSQEGILEAKLEILEGMSRGTIVLNGDDALLKQVHKRPDIAKVYFGSEDPRCDVRGSNIDANAQGLSLTVESAAGSFPVQLSLEGKHFVSDALAAVAVGLEMGVSPDNIAKSLGAFRNMDGRQEMLSVNGYTIIKDCYNAGPESMAAALAVLGSKPGRRIAVLGDMLELGDCAAAEHYRVGRIAAENAQLVLAYGPNSGRVMSGAVTGGMSESHTMAFEDRDALVAALKRLAKPGDVLLFKGSHGMHMELALEGFLGKEE